MQGVIAYRVEGYSNLHKSHIVWKLALYGTGISAHSVERIKLCVYWEDFVFEMMLNIRACGYT